LAGIYTDAALENPKTGKRSGRNPFGVFQPFLFMPIPVLHLKSELIAIECGDEGEKWGVLKKKG